MTLMQGLRLYPKAVIWSIVISTCIVMEGYDVSLIGNFCMFSRSWWSMVKCRSDVDDHVDAFDGFYRKFGELTAEGTYEIPARWQSGLSNGAQCGQIIGLLSRSPFTPLLYVLITTVNGWASERFGYRKTVLTSLICLAGFIAIFFTAQNVQTLW